MCLLPSCRLDGHQPQWETLSICPTKSQGLCLMNLLLQWGQQAVPNLNLWCVPPKGPKVRNSDRD